MYRSFELKGQITSNKPFFGFLEIQFQKVMKLDLAVLNLILEQDIHIKDDKNHDVYEHDSINNSSIYNLIENVRSYSSQYLETKPLSVSLPFWLYPLKYLMGNDESIDGLNFVYKLFASIDYTQAIPKAKLYNAFSLLYDYFEERAPVLYTGNYVYNQSFLDLAKYLFRIAISVYGYRGYIYFGQGLKYMKHYWISDAYKSSIIQYLSMPIEDIIDIQLEDISLYKPVYMIIKDTLTRSVILSIRGSMSSNDWLVTLTAGYMHYKNGYIHNGYLRASLWIRDNILPKALEKARELGYNRVILTGHSMGAAVATLVKLLYDDSSVTSKENLFEEYKEVKLSVLCFACPPLISKSLMTRFKKSHEDIHIIYYNHDEVSYLSYGNIMDAMSIVCKASEFVPSGLGYKKMTEERKKYVFDAISDIRDYLKESYCHSKLQIPGRLYRIYDLKEPKKFNVCSSSFYEEEAPDDDSETTFYQSTMDFPSSGFHAPLCPTDSKNMGLIDPYNFFKEIPNPFRYDGPPPPSIDPQARNDNIVTVMEHISCDSLEQIPIRRGMIFNHYPPSYERGLYNASWCLFKGKFP